MMSFLFFYFVSHSYLPCFCLVFCSILITELKFKFYSIFSPCSWHVVRLRRYMFILSQSYWHPFSVLLQVYKSSFHHVVPSGVQHCSGFGFSRSSSLPAATASHIVAFSLVNQLYAKEVYFCNFLTKSNSPV